VTNISDTEVVEETRQQSTADWFFTTGLIGFVVLLIAGLLALTFMPDAVAAFNGR
jgi:hypothetical protein